MFSIRVVLSLFLASATPLLAAERFKLNVAHPVLEELMGGCSMRCSFPWTVEVEAGGKRGDKVVE